MLDANHGASVVAAGAGGLVAGAGFLMGGPFGAAALAHGAVLISQRALHGVQGKDSRHISPEQ